MSEVDLKKTDSAVELYKIKEGEGVNVEQAETAVNLYLGRVLTR